MKTLIAVAFLVAAVFTYRSVQNERKEAAERAALVRDLKQMFAQADQNRLQSGIIVGVVHDSDEEAVLMLASGGPGASVPAPAFPVFLFF